MNAANSTFLIISSVLVFFMTPGLAFFYGGLVSKKNVVNTMLSVFFICGIAVVLYAAVGYELSFNGDIGGIIGQVKHFFLSGVDLAALQSKELGINVGTYLIFQMMFAIITPALFVGAIVGRMRFNFLLLFIVFWSILVYYPMVHIVWSAKGMLASYGVLDFAGGTVVHINAGITALVLSVFLGKRIDFNKKREHYNMPWVLLGTTILWIGWYGFNAGSALGMNEVAVQAFLTTTVATAAALVIWMVLDMLIVGKPTLEGVCTGTICGLVGITPAAGFVTAAGAFWIGACSTLVSFCFITYIKPKLKYDDPLDAFGCHGVSGIVGSILTGAFATKAANSSLTQNGLFYGGGWHQLLVQLVGTLFTIVFVTVVVCIIVVAMKLFVKIRVDEKEELVGLDQGEHGEFADYTVAPKLTDIEKYGEEFQGQLAHLNNPKS
ncbi:ammonium transporter [Liquorilactobacillus satsumensis]|uniref:ammonium transporter n=3 Tax=Liquorilactobacillus satsumensis TaxID=259059 RepID=UPI001E4052B9|nr:ammonium transporter [Liquorilactobacillus satsumensis]MCC7667335.1 ammonia permease [Liquorilactobacillus satsumensis]MCP9313766.1 ammonium transporter [Liquorilactobacillus satsumensis]MCP9329798.1 ammonium transporter [Liquorilactobacillus satsumensis]MCP9358225.1 ammonium transporter [Liquorilactobacillus satsumensis]MCP9360907.1 ammonium transporter [Liquorilactobacillus satsumensis]